MSQKYGRLAAFLVIASALALSSGVFGGGTEASLRAVVAGNTAFALHLHQQVGGTQPGNLFFSPHSISIALAMTCAGARGQTAEEMAQALHFALPQEELAKAFGALKVDRPSLFLLRENQAGSTLFLGRVVDPAR